MDTTGKVITCKAAVSWEPKAPLVYEDVEVDPPKKGEARIKVVATGVCHTDLSTKNGKFFVQNYPSILGHEGAGIVESVGEGVTSVKPGDHVVLSSIPQCDNCRVCKAPDKNNCKKTFEQYNGLMTDGTHRIRCRGKPVFSFLGVSSFSEYTVMNDWSLIVVNPAAPLDKVCLLSCGISTGYGAALNTAKVRKGSSCAVWGLGCIGVSTVMGCKAAGASKIIGVDINPEKAHLARALGMTDFINPTTVSRPVAEIVTEITDGGADFSFECVGSLKTQMEAFNSTHDGIGITTLVGAGNEEDRLQIEPSDFIKGRIIRGTLLGGWRLKDDVPKLVEKYMNKELEINKLITEVLPLEDVEKSFQSILKGNVCRTVIQVSS